MTKTSSVTATPSIIRSERGLDATAFFLADVADGLGPFLVIFLTVQLKWSSADAGLALAMMLLGTVLTQAFVGALLDRTKRKREAIFFASLVVASCTLLMQLYPDRRLIFLWQFVTGAAVTVFPPAIAAISLGLVGRTRLPDRAGRNEACFHAGNVVSAALAAVVSWYWGSVAVFYGVAFMALCSALAVLFIRAADIDHQLARGADSTNGECHIEPWWQLFADQRILWFMGSVVLFHFANAAMLPLVGQKVSKQMPEIAPTLMAICIIVAQLTMVPVALFASRAARHSRKGVMLIAFAVLPLRGVLYTLTASPFLLIANQILDGIGAGIFGVAALLMMADFTQGTGRFNFAQGIVATGISLGAALSNYATGLLVDHYGFNAGFLFLTSIAVVACGIFMKGVPESSNERIGGNLAAEPL